VRQQVVSRLLLFVPTLIGVAVLIFLMLRVAPGDVALSILVGPNGQGQFDQVRYEELRHQLGLDKPILLDPANLGRGSQFVEWASGIARGDWGDSLETERPVLKEISERLPTTFEIAFIAVVLAMLIGIPLGLVMAVKQDSLTDHVLRIVSIAGLSMPSFWVATLILLALVLVFHWLPPLGYRQFAQDPGTNLLQVVWAALPLGYLLSAVIARMTRSSVLDVLRNDYIRTARAKGLRDAVVMSRHALRNAFLPVITLSGLQFAGLMGGTVVMETIWNLPGLGSRLVGAINYRDYPMVEGIVLVFTVIVLLTNVLIDLAYAWIDPRVRSAR